MKTQLDRYPYAPMTRRKPLALPDDARVAIIVYLNIEHFPANIPAPAHAIYPGTQTMNPDFLNYGWRDYGNRVGLWRLADILAECGMRPYINLHADVCHEYPEIIEEGTARNWDWGAQGLRASSILNGLDEAGERALISTSLDTIERATGRRPTGWLGSHLAQNFGSLDLLAEYGIEFCSDLSCDDHPIPMHTKHGPVLAMPYTLENNDVPAILGRGHNGEEFARQLIDQFDELYQEGARQPRLMSMSFHPFVSGQAFRARHLRTALSYIARHDRVWLTSCSEVNTWYRANVLNRA